MVKKVEKSMEATKDLPAVTVPEAAPAPEVVKEMPAPEPTTEPTTDSSQLPDITGNSILDINCALRDDKRLISILERTDDRGWGVVYHKFGTKKTIAIARNDKSFCDEVASRVKNTLQTAGYQCDGDVSASSSETVEEESMVDKAKDAGEGMADKAKGIGSSMLDKAKEAGANAVDKAKEAGATAVDKAKEAAGAAADAVQGE